MNDLKFHVVYLIFIVLLCPTLSSSAREGSGDWSKVDPEVREWVKSLKRPDYPTTSCCGEADAYECDNGIVSNEGTNYCIITGSRGNPLPVGTKLLIPPDKIQNTQGNPSGHVIVFASEAGYVFCFIPSGGV